MPDYTQLKYLFTYAQGDNRRFGYSPALIFVCLDPSDTQFHNRETPLTIARHPLVKEIMGDTFFVQYFDGGEAELRHCNRGVQRWVFFKDIAGVLRSMDTGSHDNLLLQIEGKPLGTVTPQNILDNCYLPHKYAMTCMDCATGSSSNKHSQSEHNCILKNSLQRYESGRVITTSLPSSINLQDIREDFELVNRKTQIDKFVFISPVLTADGIPSPVRPVHAHDFTRIQEYSDRRSDGQHERHRFVRFQEEVCPTCSMRAPCMKTRADYSRRSCPGPYPTDQKEIVEEILSNVRIPFSNAQLRFLLAHSGILYKRYKRRIVAGTFGMDGNELCYRIRHKTKPYAYHDAFRFNNFREASKFLREHNESIETKYLPPFTRELKAILCELASHDASPRCHYYWRTVSYPLLYIQAYGRGFRTTYSYQGRGTTGFGMSVNTLTDIYENFEYFNFSYSRSHELARSSRY